MQDSEAADRPSDRPSDEARDPAAADVAHELGNRLAAIVAFSHLIRTDPRLPEDLHDQAALLVDEADRTRQLVERLLASTRPQRERATTSAPTPTAAPPAARASVGPPLSRVRILIVDDEPAIRDFLARVLGRLGYEPIVAQTGEEALAIVRSDAPDAILSDYRMAGMSGPAFHDAVRALSPELAARFAFMSGDVTDPMLRALAAERGVILLAKPFDMEQVGQTVGDLVGP